MSAHPTNFQGSVVDAVREAIERAIPGSQATVLGGGGHFTIEVVAAAFSGKGMLESQRLVYSAIAHLMKGDAPAVHAVDSLKTRTPPAS
jgi:acid stress-induced BolA-like protein IbaG/YrbA